MFFSQIQFGNPDQVMLLNSTGVYIVGLQKSVNGKVLYYSKTGVEMQIPCSFQGFVVKSVGRFFLVELGIHTQLLC